MKIRLSHCLVVAALLTNSACARKAEVARRDYILGADHGWVDLALVPAAGTVSADTCGVQLTMNREELFATGVPMPQGEGAPAVGFRMPVPVGKLVMELTVSDCVPKEITLSVPVDLAKDHLARLEFDGKTLRLASTGRFEPATLDYVHTQMLKLETENNQSSQSLEKLMNFAKGSLVLNGLLLLAVAAGFLRRRK